MSEQSNDGGPAFPLSYSTAEYHTGNINAGMSLRDWFAGQALQGAMASWDGEGEWRASDMATLCWNRADAMLATRNLQPA